MKVTEDHYNYLKIFPLDESYISNDKIEELTKFLFDDERRMELSQELHYTEMVNGSIWSTGLRINQTGKDAIRHYEETTGMEKKIAELSFKKLNDDARISSRIVKTFIPTTIITWATFLLALFLGFLKLAELLKWWPYRK